MCLLRKERTGFVEPARKRIGRLRWVGLDGLPVECIPYCHGLTLPQLHLQD